MEPCLAEDTQIGADGGKDREAPFAPAGIWAAWRMAWATAVGVHRLAIQTVRVACSLYLRMAARPSTLFENHGFSA